jgi:hypothetical protein
LKYPQFVSHSYHMVENVFYSKFRSAMYNLCSSFRIRNHVHSSKKRVNLISMCINEEWIVKYNTV